MMVNLGCGDDYRDEYSNIDVRSEVDPDVKCDINQLPMKSASVSHIYCKDVLEHFWSPVKVLKECQRVLVTKGTIEAIVPDWHKLGSIEYWENKDHEQIEKHIYGGHKNPYDHHHTMWTDELATKRFDKAGFHNIEIEHLRDSPLHWHMKIEATA